MKKTAEKYVSPTFCIIDVAVEQGFAATKDPDAYGLFWGSFDKAGDTLEGGNSYEL